MGHYLGMIQPYRADFIANPDEDEMEIMKEHYEYLKGLLESGKLVLAGPTTEETDPVGIYIFETDNLKAARELFENDPSIKAGIQKIIRLQPMRISLSRPLEQ